MASDEGAGSIAGVGIPSTAKGGSRTGATTVRVVFAAEAKVVPFRDVAGARDATGVCAEKVGSVEGCGILDTAENDEP